MSSRVFRSARLISLLTLVSRVLGLVRDMACSRAFGVEPVWAAFTVAFQIPNLFRRLFGEGALSAASIPVLTARLAHDGREAVDGLAGRLMTLLMLVLAGVCLVAEAVVAVLYWRYHADSDTALLLALTAIMLPYMVLICAAATLGGIQNVFDRFGAPAAAPVILNLFMIAAVLSGEWLTMEKRRGIVLLSASVVAAGIVQLTWQWWSTRRCGLKLPLQLDARDPDIRRILWTMAPMIGGLAAVQLNTLADSLIAWWFVPGRVGPGILAYAQRLYQLPLGIFAIALATAIFPALSRHAAVNDQAGLGATLSRGLRVATFEALPCLVGLILVREPLIRVLFEGGQFAEAPDAVERVAFALFMYALGIWAFGLNQLIVRAFYAMQDPRTPVRISLVNVVLNVALNLWLVHTVLRESGLALATSICAWIQVVFLLRRFHQRIGHIAWREVVLSAARCVAATAAMAVAVLAVGHLTRESGELLRLIAMVAVGAVTYPAAAWLVRAPEIRELLRR